MSRNTFLFNFLLFSFLPGLTSMGQKPDPGNLNSKLEQYLSIQHQKIAFSGVLLVARNDSVVFEQSIGLASIEQGVPLSTSSKFVIASISKTFTGALVALAHDEGLLQYTDKLSLYFENLPVSFQTVTIHQLLAHTSGLPHNEALPAYWGTTSRLHLTEDQALKEICKLSLLATPGSRMKYSSLGYYLLALVIEKVYKKPFTEILSLKLLRPLGMENSGTNNNRVIIPNMATGYQKVSEDSLVMAPYRDFSMQLGAGDMYSTARDLLKWSRNISKGTMFKQGTREIIFTPNLPAENKEHSSYGYGWYIKGADETPLAYHHGGGTWGYTSYIAIYPNEDVTIILLSNVASLPIESFWNDISKFVFNIPVEMPAFETELILEKEAMAHFPGLYISEPGARKLNILSNSGKLFAKLEGKPAFEIFFKGNDTFFAKSMDINFTFSRDKEGRIRSIYIKRALQEFTFNKIN